MSSVLWAGLLLCGCGEAPRQEPLSRAVLATTEGLRIRFPRVDAAAVQLREDRAFLIAISKEGWVAYGVTPGKDPKAGAFVVGNSRMVIDMQRELRSEAERARAELRLGGDEPLVLLALDEETPWALGKCAIDACAGAGLTRFGLLVKSGTGDGLHVLMYADPPRESPPPGFGQRRVGYDVFVVSASDEPSGAVRCWIYGWERLPGPWWLLPGLEASSKPMRQAYTEGETNSLRALSAELARVAKPRADDQGDAARTWLNVHLRTEPWGAWNPTAGVVVPVLARVLAADVQEVDGLRSRTPMMFRGLPCFSGQWVEPLADTSTQQEYERFLSGSTGSRSRASRASRALRWLAAHQSAAGGWDASGAEHWCWGIPSRPDVGEVDASARNVCVSAFALLAFLACDVDGTHAEPIDDIVHRGLTWLQQCQTDSGLFCSAMSDDRDAQDGIYVGQGAATLACVVAYRCWPSEVRRCAAQRALNYALSRVRGTWGWVAADGPRNADAVVTALLGLSFLVADGANEATRSEGRPGPFELPPTTVRRIYEWAKVEAQRDPRSTGDLNRQEARLAAAALTVLTGSILSCCDLSWEDEEEPTAITFLKDAVLQENGFIPEIDPPICWIAMNAIIEAGTKADKGAWLDASRDTVFERQAPGDDDCGLSGSWAPTGPWCDYLERVGFTALHCLISRAWSEMYAGSEPSKGKLTEALYR